MKYVITVLVLAGCLLASESSRYSITPFGIHEVMVECSNGQPRVTLVPQPRLDGVRIAVDIVCDNAPATE